MHKRSRRAKATAHLRSGFLERAAIEVEELAALLAENDDEDLIDSVVFDLGRLSATADSLGLGVIATAFSDAAALLPQRGIDATSAVRSALRGEAPPKRVSHPPELVSQPPAPWGPDPPFAVDRVAPIAVVVADERERRRLEAVSSRFCEPFVFAESGRNLLERDVLWAGALLPFDDLAIREVRDRVPGALALYGPEGRMDCRLLAQSHGAEVYLPLPIDLVAAMSRIREHPAPSVRTRVLLVAEADDSTVVLRAELGRQGIDVALCSNAQDLFDRLDADGPHAVLLAPEVNGRPYAELIGLVRTHLRHRFLPVFVWRASDGVGAIAAGADDVLPAVRASRKLLARLDRVGSSSGEFRRPFGVLGRSKALDQLDGLVEASKRYAHVLTVGVVILTGLGDRSAEARYTAQRLLAEALATHVRRGDLVGVLDPSSFVVAFPETEVLQLEQRLTALRRRFQQSFKGNRELRRVSMVWGLADSERGHAELLSRADAAAARRIRT